MLKTTDVRPNPTVTLEGTVAALALLRSTTTTPPVGAGPDSRTVPVTLLPPVTAEADNEMLDSVTGAGLMLKDAVWEAPLYVAVIVADWLAVTEFVAMLKGVDVRPDVTVTLAGTVAALALLRKATTTPPTGAGPDSRTVPVTLFPPTTDWTDSVRPNRVTGAGSTLRVAV